MRRSEQYNAEWKNVNFDQRILTVPRSKNGKMRRVFLNDNALVALRALWGFSKGSGNVFSHLYSSEKTYGAREWFEKAIKEAGISDFHWHDLRHTFASRLAMAGVELFTIKEAMGHKTITVTMRYAHLAPSHQLAAVQRLCDTKTATGPRTDTKQNGQSPTTEARPN